MVFMSVCDGAKQTPKATLPFTRPPRVSLSLLQVNELEKKRFLNYHFKVINLHYALNAVPSDLTHLAFYRDDVISVHPVPINGCPMSESQMARDPRWPRVRGQDADAWKVVASSQG